MNISGRFLVAFTLLLFLFGCSSTKEIKRSSKNWVIPESKDLQITLKNGDVFIFQKNEYKVFLEKKVLKGLGTKGESIRKVTIPYDEIVKVEVLRSRIINYLAVTGFVILIGGTLYYLLN